MNTVILTILALIVFGIPMGYKEYKRRKKLYMYPVEAGGTKMKTTIDFSKEIMVNTPGVASQMNKELTYFVVQNQCMSPKHIYHNDVVGVRMFNGTFTIEQVKEGDVLLIWLDDQNFKGYKIRIKGNFDGTDAYETFYYEGNKIKKSHKNHKISTIKGVVEEVIHCGEMACCQ